MHYQNLLTGENQCCPVFLKQKAKGIKIKHIKCFYINCKNTLCKEKELYKIDNGLQHAFF